MCFVRQGSIWASARRLVTGGLLVGLLTVWDKCCTRAGRGDFTAPELRGARYRAEAPRADAGAGAGAGAADASAGDACAWKKTAAVAAAPKTLDDDFSLLSSGSLTIIVSSCQPSKNKQCKSTRIQWIILFKPPVSFILNDSQLSYLFSHWMIFH